MDNNLQLVNTIESIGVFLAAFPALWISGSIVLRNFATETRAIQILLWLALGGLFLAPVTDIVRYTTSILSLIIPSLRNANPTMVLLGVGPFLLYSTLSMILGILIYGFALYYARLRIIHDQTVFRQRLQLTNLELGFVILGIAGLVNQMVRGIVVRLVTLYIPGLTALQDLTLGLSGFWISWLLAVLILIVILFIMNEKIYRNENEILH